MPAAEAPGYRLSPKALEDLEEVWRYTTETWSATQADTYIDDLTRAFEAIAAAPTLARERPEFTPPVRIHPHQSHLIAYVVRDETVTILRVLGGRQNWRAVLGVIDS